MVISPFTRVGEGSSIGFWASRGGWHLLVAGMLPPTLQDRCRVASHGGMGGVWGFMSVGWVRLFSPSVVIKQNRPGSQNSTLHSARHWFSGCGLLPSSGFEPNQYGMLSHRMKNNRASPVQLIDRIHIPCLVEISPCKETRPGIEKHLLDA